MTISLPKDLDALFAALEAVANHCCVLMNAAQTNPEARKARWIASGASAQYTLDDNNHCGIALDAMQKSGIPYIRVRVISHTQGISPSLAKKFATFYNDVAELAEALEQYLARQGFGEADALERASK